MVEQVKIKNKPHNEHKQTGADAKVINKIVDFVIYILAYPSLYNILQSIMRLKVSVIDLIPSTTGWIWVSFSFLFSFFLRINFSYSDETTTINRNQMHFKSNTQSEQAIREREKKKNYKKTHWEIKINDCPREKKGLFGTQHSLLWISKSFCTSYNIIIQIWSFTK